MFFRKEFFLGTLFTKFSFPEKIFFWNFLILNFFFSKEIIFQNFNFFQKKNVSCKFSAFPEKKFGNTNLY